MSFSRYLSKLGQLLNSSGQVTVTGHADGSVTPVKLSSDAQFMGFKSRIINGAMMIDQRNAGASVSLSASGVFPVDRFRAFGGDWSSGKATGQRSTTAPAGFINSLLITSSAATSASSGQRYGLAQAIEGFNVADLNWGTANAQAVTLSFQVRSSLTGTFAGAIRNDAGSRSFVFTYTISAANTWTPVTVLISGDTTGTWTTDNSAGLYVVWDMGSGSAFNGTAGVWNAGDYERTSGSVSLIATNGATFYITGVQLEKGTQATSFDFRSIGTEFSLCQRYFQTNIPYGTAPTNGLSTYISTVLNAYSTGGGYGSWITFPTVMRATPTTFTFYKPSASVGADGQWVYYTGTWVSFTTTGTAQAAPTGFAIEAVKGSAFTSNLAYIMLGSYTASAEL